MRANTVAQVVAFKTGLVTLIVDLQLRWNGCGVEKSEYFLGLCF